MDTVTYPDEAVAAEVRERFVAVHVNVREAGPRERELAREFRQTWTPTLVFLDPHRIELRRGVGYLPPGEFLPELRFVRGYAALFRGEAGQAFELFRALAEEHPRAAVAPEALYWAAVAGYRRSGEREELRRGWTLLRERYPDSPWWTRASFIEG
jgi:hypothetical protein